MINTTLGAETSPQHLKNRVSDQMYITMLVAGVAIGLFLVASVFVPNFFQVQNMLNLVTNNWSVIALGVGVSFLLISGNFDLSVGGIVALSGVLSVWFAQAATGGSALSTGLGLPYWLAIIGALVGALAIGGLNALFVVKFKIPSIIVTLGTMMVARGIAQVITEGSQRNTNLPAEFGYLGNLKVFGTSMQFPVLFMLLLLAAAIFIERKTVFGRITYWIGANPEAAKLSGINNAKHITYLYLFSALVAELSAFCFPLSLSLVSLTVVFWLSLMLWLLPYLAALPLPVASAQLLVCSSARSFSQWSPPRLTALPCHLTGNLS